MPAPEPSFFIGIDLGTTNSSLAYAPATPQLPQKTDPDVHILPLLQPESESTSIESPILPSALWLPPGQSSWLPGRIALHRAPLNPSRTVRSSKSWLAFPAADRRAPFLPIASSDVPPTLRLSPLSAASLLLQFLASQWHRHFPNHPISDQNVLITVPASFDPIAQQLTLEAALSAGLPPHTSLLEEPQAAFCFWLKNHAAAELQQLLSRNPNPTLLVIDIGGGTSDFTLFSLIPSNSPLPTARRLAVSPHLLLGGDNLDLALAHELERRLSADEPLPPQTFASLLLTARSIKELALQNSPSSTDEDPSFPVSVALPGSSLLHSTLQTHIRASEVRSLLLDGFFPLVGPRESPLRNPPGLREMGLPYPRDPAITRHLAHFLRNAPPIDAVLFNGGSTKPRAIRNRILQCLAAWQGFEPLLLHNPQPELAVSLGAVHYQLLTHSPSLAQPLLDSSSPYSYFLLLDSSRALCILPAHTPHQTPIRTSPPGLAALPNRPISLPLARSLHPNPPPAGSILTPDDSFHPLPPAQTILQLPPSYPNPNAPIPVALSAQILPTGLLQLNLETLPPLPPHQWNLHFSLRHSSPSSGLSTSQSPTILSTAQTLCQLLLNPKPPPHHRKLTANSLLQIAERTLQSPRHLWPGSTARALADPWLELAPSLPSLDPSRQEAWWQIVGFLLRPGWGILGDELRTESLAHLLLQPAKNHGGLRLQRYIALRRIAPAIPRHLIPPLWHHLLQNSPPQQPPHPELLLALASLEAAPPELKSSLATQITSLLAQPNPPSPQLLWRALGLTLSRILPRAGSEAATPPHAVLSAWQSLQSLSVPQQLQPEAAQCWLRAARLTGLRELDLPLKTRREIDSTLRRWNIPDPRRRPLHEVVPLTPTELPTLLGETPPPGLLLTE